MAPKRPIHQYEEGNLVKALLEIRNGTVSIREASRRFGVPRGTLQDRLHGRVPEGPRKMGPDAVLSAAEESKIADWCMALAKCGFPRKPDDVLNTVYNIIKDDGRKNPFTENRPGKKWYASFLKRNPKLVHREPEGISKGRGIVTEESLRKWFSELEKFLADNNWLDILTDPSRILNGDETSFNMCPKTGKVIAPKGWKNVYQLQLGKEKETITVLLVFSAAGETLPPLVVFPYIRPPKDVTDSVPVDWFLGRSDTGWMKSEIFYEYVANCLNKWVQEKNIKKPVLFFVDGHKTHVTLHLSQFCSDNDIILYALPPNATHIMQPADVSVFKPLKSDWKSTVRKWQILPENVNSVLTRSKFCPLLKSVLEDKDLSKAIKNGFRRCGLYPFNVNAVDFSKCIQNAIENLSCNKSPELEINTNKCKFDQKDYDMAIDVIKSIEKNLIAKDIDCSLIFDEIQKAKDLNFNASSSATAYLQETEVVNTCTTLIQDLLDDVEINTTENRPISLTDISLNDFSGVEAGVYSVDNFGNLTLTNSNDSRPLYSSTNNIDCTDIFENHDTSIQNNKNDTGTSMIRDNDKHIFNKNGDSNKNQNDYVAGNEINEDTDVSQPMTLNENNVGLTGDVNEPLKDIRRSKTPDKIKNTDEMSGNSIGVLKISNHNVRSSQKVSEYLEKHLFYPEPLQKKGKRKISEERQPSAISSRTWRIYTEGKLREKEVKKQAVLQRKEERLKRKAEKEAIKSSKKKRKVIKNKLL